MFTLTFGRVPKLSYAVKDLLVKVLVRKKSVATENLVRKVTFSDNCVTIEDNLSDPSMKVTHIDKFSTIHMGSSRYAHMNEELIRGNGYKNSITTYDDNGVIIKAEIKFL